jgi:uncharacterized membrane protein YqjE
MSAAPLGRVLGDLAAQLAALAHTRLELFSLEAAEARDRLLCRLALLLTAAIFLLLALLVATATFALYVWPGENRYLALGLLALGYAVIGAILAAWLWRRLRQDPPPFAVTAEVLAEDARALRPGPAAQAPRSQPVAGTPNGAAGPQETP